MSWASVVRRSLPAVSVLNPNAPAWNPPPRAPFHAFCADCGKEAQLCAKGCDRPPISSWNGEDVCGRCFHDAMRRLGSDSMSYGIIQGADKKNDPPFKCRACSSDAPAGAGAGAGKPMAPQAKMPQTKAIIVRASKENPVPTKLRVIPGKRNAIFEEDNEGQTTVTTTLDGIGTVLWNLEKGYVQWKIPEGMSPQQLNQWADLQASCMGAFLDEGELEFLAVKEDAEDYDEPKTLRELIESAWFEWTQSRDYPVSDDD